MDSAQIHRLKKRSDMSIATIKQHIADWLVNQDYVARNKVVMAYTPLVLKYAYQYRRNNNEDDLINEGVLAIMHALNSYDLSYNVLPATYFKYSIIKAIKHHGVFHSSQIHLGSGKINRFIIDNLEKAKHRLQIYNAALTANDVARLAEFLNVDSQSIIFVYNTLYGTVSVDDDIDEPENHLKIKHTLKASDLSPEEYMINQAYDKLRPHLHSAIAQLDSRDADIFVRKNMVEPPERTEVLSTKYNVSRQTINQINNRLINKVTNIVLTQAELV